MRNALTAEDAEDAEERQEEDIACINCSLADDPVSAKSWRYLSVSRYTDVNPSLLSSPLFFLRVLCVLCGERVIALWEKMGLAVVGRLN